MSRAILVKAPLRHRGGGPNPFGQFDTIFACGIMLTALYPLILGSFTGVFFILLPFLYFWFRTERVYPLVKRVWPVLLLAAFPLLSAIWSEAPGRTLYYGTQFALTVLAAVMIGAGCRSRDALNGLFMALFIHGTHVFIHGLRSGKLAIFQSGGLPFVGLAGSKNSCADMACLGLFIALAKLKMSVDEKRFGGVLIAIVLIAIDVVIILRAKSAGAYATGSIAAAAFLLFSFVSRLPVQWRTGSIAVALMGATIAGASSPVWFEPLFERFLQSTGKDETYTGRTYIWSRAEVMIHKKPLLGEGFSSFWQEGKLEPEAIWETMYVFNKVGFNFHSSIYEIMINFGYFGLCLFGIIIFFSIIKSMGRFVISPSAITMFFITVLLYDLMRFRFESLPLGVFAHNAIALYGALAHGFGTVVAVPSRSRLTVASASV